MAAGLLVVVVETPVYITRQKQPELIPLSHLLRYLALLVGLHCSHKSCFIFKQGGQKLLTLLSFLIIELDKKQSKYWPNMINKIKVKCKKGFTLIELLIVVAIIGILAAIAIPQFAAYRQRAYNSAAQSDIKNSKTALEAFYHDYAQYPN